ncbi:MAG: hypothetical protein ACYC4R_06735 [Anaerolineae bacterium]
MAEEDIVGILVVLLERGESWFSRRFGPQALSEAEDLRDAVAAHMEGETSYGSLWDDFQKNPRELVGEMTGALEAVEESQPAVARILNARLQAWREALPGSRRSNAAARDDVEPPGDEIPDMPTLESDAFQRADGEYLYGNLQRGYDRIDEDTDEDEEATGLRIEELEVISEEEPEGVAPLFDRLMLAVEGEASIDRDARNELEQVLQALRVEAFDTERSGPEELVRYLRAVMDLSHKIGRMTVDGLRALRDQDRTLREALERIDAQERNRSR